MHQAALAEWHMCEARCKGCCMAFPRCWGLKARLLKKCFSLGWGLVKQPRFYRSWAGLFIAKTYGVSLTFSQKAYRISPVWLWMFGPYSPYNEKRIFLKISMIIGIYLRHVQFKIQIYIHTRIEQWLFDLYVPWPWPDFVHLQCTIYSKRIHKFSEPLYMNLQTQAINPISNFFFDMLIPVFMHVVGYTR